MGEDATVRLRLFYSGELARGAKYLDLTLELLGDLRLRGIRCELNDTDGWSAEKFRKAFDEATDPTVHNSEVVRKTTGFAKYVSF